MVLSGMNNFNSASRKASTHPGLKGTMFIQSLCRTSCRTLIVVGSDASVFMMEKMLHGCPRPLMVVSLGTKEDSVVTRCKSLSNFTFEVDSENDIVTIASSLQPNSLVLGCSSSVNIPRMLVNVTGDMDLFVSKCIVQAHLTNTPRSCIDTLWNAVTCKEGRERLAKNSENSQNSENSLAITIVESRKNNWLTVLSMLACMANIITSKDDDMVLLGRPVLVTNHRDNYIEMLRMVDPDMADKLIVLPLEDEEGISLDDDNFSLHRYNHMLMSETWWKRLADLNIAHVLMIQDDGTLARPCHISREYGGDKYDYIGAPWIGGEQQMRMIYDVGPDSKGRAGGNGGLSLRNVRAMMDACRRGHSLRSQDMIGIPEDVFFSKLVPGNRLPPVTLSKTFSSEFSLTMYPPSYGFHKIWAYHPMPNVDKYFHECKSRS